MNAAVAQIDSVGDGNLWIVDDFEETVAQVLDIVFDALGGRSQRHVQRTASGFRRVNCYNNARFISCFNLLLQRSSFTVLSIGDIL